MRIRPSRRRGRPRRNRPRRLRPALADPRRPVRLADHRHRRQHGAQRRPADARRPGPAGGQQHRAAVDGRRLRAGLRRPALHRWRPGRPLRSQGSAAGRPHRVRLRLAGRRPRRIVDPGDRRPIDHGRRGGIHHALDAVHPDQRLPGPRAGQGDRHLGRHLRRRRSHRARDLGPAARALLVGRGVPHQPAHHRHRPGRRLAAGPDTPRTRRRRRSTRSVPCCRSSASVP